jgi:ankyrin repeat protein
MRLTFVCCRPDTSLWQEALSQLPKQVQNEIATSSKGHRALLQEIVKDVEVKRDTCLAEKWTLKWRGETIAVRDIAERISTAVNRFVAIGDQVAQYDPAHFGLPWAGVRFLLVVAASNQQAISNALVGTEYVTSCLSRCAIYELLYLNSSIKLDSSGSLRKSLVGLYRGILLFLVKAKKYLAHSTARRIASNISKGDEFSTLLADVEKQEQVVRLNADNADAEYMRSVGTSVTGIRTDLRDLRDLLSLLPVPLAVISLKVDALAITTNETHTLVSQIHSELDAFDATLSRQEKEKLIRGISDKDQTERYRALRDAHQSGTALWLMDVEDVKSLTYRTFTRSQIVWVQGKPGIGKSVQMAAFSKMLKDDFSSSTSLVEYYVTSSDNEKYRTSKEILRCVLAQLYTVTGDTPIEDKSQLREAQLKTSSSSMSDLPNEQVIRLIVQQIKKMGNVSILVDALDECSDCQQAALAFRGIVEQVKDSKLQILITSRDHIRPLRTTFKKKDYVKVFDVHEWRSKLNDVIRLYCNLKLDEMVKSGTFAVDLEPETEKQISAAVVENAEGMILYAKLFLRELGRVSTKNELLNAIEKPPVGFRDLLIQWAKRIESDETRLGTLPIRVCQWVLTANRQLTLDELREAVSIEANHTRWDEGNFPDAELILESCAGIVETDEKNVVRFVHASVREFFEGPSPFGPDEWATEFFGLAENREILMGKLCLTYLDFDDFDCGGSKTPEELIERFSKYKFLDYAAKNWAKHLRGEGEHQCKKEWHHFLSMSDAKLANWCECFYMTTAFLRENGGNATQAGHLSYFHIPSFPKEALDMHLTAIFGLETLFDELDAKTDKAVSLTKRGFTPLHQASDWQRVPIIYKLIPLSTAVINHQSLGGWTPINVATTRDLTSVVKALGGAGADASLTMASIPTPLLHASQWGYLATVEVLLEMGANPDEQSGELLEVPLHGACKAGFLGVAEMLLNAGASISIENKIGLTPFHSACFRGDIALIELLLRSHDEEGKREIVLRPQGRVLNDLQFDEILTSIAMADSAEAKELLLKYGADPSVTNKWGRNALEYSVHHSSMDVLRKIFKMPSFKACMHEEGDLIEIQHPVRIAMQTEVSSALLMAPGRAPAPYFVTQLFALEERLTRVSRTFSKVQPLILLLNSLSR